jgi:hypothetical protein
MGCCTHTLLHLLGISNWSSSHQCPTQCIFSFEYASDIETVPNSSEFLRNTLNIWDITVPWYTVSEEGRLPLDGVYKLLWVFTEHQIMSYIFNFVVEILLIMTARPTKL